MNEYPPSVKLAFRIIAENFKNNLDFPAIRFGVIDALNEIQKEENEKMKKNTEGKTSQWNSTNKNQSLT